MAVQAVAPPKRGSLEDKPFPVLLYELYGAQWSGVVVLRRGDVVKEFHVERGHVKFASSTAEEERFGQFLCRMGKVTVGQIEYALEAAKKQKVLLGKILVDAGFVKPPDLLAALREQIKGIVVEAFAWPDGTFELQPPREGPQHGVVKLSMDVEALVREGMRRITDPLQLIRGIGTMDTTVALTTNAARAMKEFRPTEKEKRIIGMAGRGIRLRDLCNALPYPAVETCQLVYGLLTFGVLEKTGEPM